MLVHFRRGSFCTIQTHRTLTQPLALISMPDAPNNLGDPNLGVVRSHGEIQ